MVVQLRNQVKFEKRPPRLLITILLETRHCLTRVRHEIVQRRREKLYRIKGTNGRVKLLPISFGQLHQTASARAGLILNVFYVFLDQVQDSQSPPG